VPGYPVEAFYLAIPSAIAHLPDRRMGGALGFNFDSFDLWRMKDKRRDGSNILVTNGAVYLEMEFGGSVLPSTAKSRLIPPAHIAEGPDLGVLELAKTKTRVFRPLSDVAYMVHTSMLAGSPF